MTTADRGVSDVFLSYAASDRPRVAVLAAALGDIGWDVWWDRSIPPGKSFDEIIEDALSGTRCVVVVWTEDSVKSRWVKTEAAEGLSREILVPVLFDQVELPLAFRRIQAADLTEWQPGEPHTGFSELISAIRGLVEHGANGSISEIDRPVDVDTARDDAEVAEPVEQPGVGADGPARPVNRDRLDHLFATAQEAIAAEDWKAAVSRLEDIVRMDPEYPRAAEALETARSRQRAGQLYRSAVLLAEAGQWNAVLDRFEQIDTLDPAIPDNDELRATATERVSEEEREKRLERTYIDANAAFEAARWAEAAELLGQIESESPGFKNAGRLLSEAEGRMRSDELYAEARGAVEGERWQTVLDRFAEMDQLGHEFVQDPEGWRELATEHLANQELHERLDVLYETTLTLIEEEQYAEAAKVIEEIEEHEPGYRGIDALGQRVKAQLDQEQQARIAERYEEGRAALEAGRYDEAARHLEWVMANAPDYEDADELLAEARAGMRTEEHPTEIRDQPEPPTSAPPPRPADSGGARQAWWLFAALGAVAVVAVVVVVSVLIAVSGDSVDPADETTVEETTTTAPPDLVEVPGTPIVYTTDFETDDGRWSIGDRQAELVEISREIQNGVYRWEVTRSSGVHTRAWPSDLDSSGHFFVTTDAFLSDGIADYGLIFREGSDGHYYFRVDPSGSFTVSALIDDEWTTVVEWTITDTIAPDGTNQLSVRGQGSQYEFGINGAVVAEADDDRLLGGVLGLAINVSEGDTATVEFDSFSVR